MNCEWSQWSKWSICSQSCGGGKRTSKRTVRIESKQGGEECSGEDVREETCNLHPCPGKPIKMRIYFSEFLLIFHYP